MAVRLQLLRALFAAPRFKGRDRLIDTLSRSFAPRATSLDDGLQLYIDPSEWGQLDLVIRNANEPLTLKLIDKLVPRGGVVIDVGAHVGHHALIAAKATGPSGRVFAFDPQPYNADRIAQHAQLNGLSHLITICGALGDCDGMVRLPIQSNRDRSRLSVLGGGPSDMTAVVQTSIQRLDAFLSENHVDGVDLIKIDVEGYELEVLRGLGDRLASCDNIILEVLDQQASERLAGILELLQSARFTLANVEAVAWAPGDHLPENNLWARRTP